jgi:hypothetical protein
MTSPKSSLNVIVGTTKRSIEAIPSAWFRMKVHQVCPDAGVPLGMYFDTVDCAISMPIFRSSPWIRGAPLSGLARLILRIRSRTFFATFGRPAAPRDFQRQYTR